MNLRQKERILGAVRRFYRCLRARNQRSGHFGGCFIKCQRGTQPVPVIEKEFVPAPSLVAGAWRLRNDIPLNEVDGRLAAEIVGSRVWFSAQSIPQSLYRLAV